MGLEHGMGFGGLFMWIIAILIIVLLVWLIRAVTGGDRGERGGDARELLDRRYARGEIDRETYERMRRELE